LNRRAKGKSQGWFFQTAKACGKSGESRIGMDNYNGAEDKCYKHQILHGVLEELLRDWLVTLCV
jgi:hypothetical protein